MKEKLFYLLQELKDNFSEKLLDEVLQSFDDLLEDDLYGLSKKEKELFNDQNQMFYQKLGEIFISDLNNNPEMYFLCWENQIEIFSDDSKSIFLKLSLELADGTDAADYINGLNELNELRPEIALFHFNRIDHYVSCYFISMCYLELDNYENCIKNSELFLDYFQEMIDDVNEKAEEFEHHPDILIVKWNVFLDLGYCNCRIGDFSKAKNNYEKAFEIFDLKFSYGIRVNHIEDGYGDFEIIINNYLAALEKTSNYTKGVEVLEFLLTKYPNDNYYQSLITKFKENSTKHAFADQIIAKIFKPKTPFGIDKFEATKLIAKEKILEDMIVEQIKYGFMVFGKCLEIYQDKEIFGRQYYIASVNGILDLLLIDKSDNTLYIVELKRNESGTEVVDQIEKYIVGLSAQLERKIKGIICLHRPDEDLKRAVRNKPEIELFTYHFDFKQEK